MIGEEFRDLAEERTEEFKQRVFAGDPRLFHELFVKAENQPDFDIAEWEPETQDDVQRMMGELRRMGFD